MKRGGKIWLKLTLRMYGKKLNFFLSLFFIDVLFEFSLKIDILLAYAKFILEIFKWKRIFFIVSRECANGEMAMWSGNEIGKSLPKMNS